MCYKQVLLKEGTSSNTRESHMGIITRTVPEVVVMQRRRRKSLGFELRFRRHFTAEESAMRDYLWLHHFFLIGAWGVGKDTVMDGLERLGVTRIPEYRSDRDLRPGEISGKHLIPMTREKIASRRSSLLIEYLAHAGIQGRESVAALDLNLFMSALGRFSASIIYPDAIPWLDWEAIVFKIEATEEDHRRMLVDRGADPDFNIRNGAKLSEMGSWAPRTLYLPSTTIPVRNVYGDPEAASREILGIMQKITADPALAGQH